MASAKWPTAAPLRIFDNLRCGYWSAVSPCVSSTQVGGPPRQHKQRSSTTFPRGKNTQDTLRKPVASVAAAGRSAGGRRVAAVAGGPECSKDLGPLVRAMPVLGRALQGLEQRRHCWFVAAAVAEAGAGALRRCAATVAAVARRLCCCGARTVSSGQQSLDGTEHHGPRAASPGVECRRASARRHRERPTAAPAPPTSPDGKRSRGCCERRCGKGGCLAGPASEAAWSARRCQSCWHTESGNKEASTASFQQARPSKPQAPSALAFRRKSVRSRRTRSARTWPGTPRRRAISA